MIYQKYLDLCGLTLEHRQELRQKRGFTDTTIDTFRLVSGGPQNEAHLLSLKEVFPIEELIAAGLFVRINEAIFPNKQLLEERVIIPYLNEDAPYHVRPHKLGFKKLAPQIFSRSTLKSKPPHVVLTEGEFKAIALWQWGIPAIAIPGISSFGGKHFEVLVNLLREFEVKKVTVIFDHEVKDNPAYPNFKDKMEDRYDTQFWAYIMAYRLNKEGFEANVGELPGAWMVQGKVDFDMALAQGRTKSEIEKCINAALPPGAYLKEQSDEAKKVLSRKIGRHFARSNIRREFNKYVVKRRKGDEAWDEVISNFVVNIKSSHFTVEGVIRYVQFVNEFNEESDIFPMDPGDMAGVDSFKKFCFGKGNYVFEGKGDDLNNIWKFEFLRDSGEFIYAPEVIGRISDDVWLFGNMAICGQDIYYPDDSGIIWIDGKGYKPQGLTVGSKGESITDNSIPALWTKEFDFRDAIEKLRHCVGGFEAYIGVGWVVATIFSKDIFRRLKCFPFIFPHGKRESGKTTFMRWMFACFGIETEGLSIAESSQNSIMRWLAYYSSLGVWLDEYRNERDVQKKDGYLRSAYNRQVSGKGVKQSFGVQGYTVNSTLAISGEEMPKDNGLFTRCIPIQFSSNKRDRTYFDWINKHSEKFSYLTYYLIMNYGKYRDRVVENIVELKKQLVAKGIGDRTAENWAIVVAAFDTIVGDGMPDSEWDQKILPFIQWAEVQCQEIKQQGEQDHMLNQFWDDLNFLWSAGKVDGKYIRVDGSSLSVWFNGAFEIWAEHYRRKNGREAFDRSSIMKYLQDEPYFLKSNKKTRLKSGVKSCFVINIPEATEAIKELAEAINDSQKMVGDY